MIASKEHSSPWWPSSAPGMSYAVAPSRSATALTWSPGTYRNSASGSSTPRVTTWRNLQRLGAGRLTPGAAVVPYREDLHEQFDWVAQEIENLGGDAWVLPVTGLSEAEERAIRDNMLADRKEEYRALEHDARAFLERRSAHPLRDDDYAARLQVDKELLA